MCWFLVLCVSSGVVWVWLWASLCMISDLVLNVVCWDLGWFLVLGWFVAFYGFGVYCLGVGSVRWFVI